MPDEKTLIFHKSQTRHLILKLAGCNSQSPGRKQTIPRHSHDLWSLDFCSSGMSHLEIEHRKYAVKKGDIILIAPGDEHRFIYTDSAFSCYSFKFELPGLSDLPEKISIYAGDAANLKQREGIITAVGSCLAGFCPARLLDMNMEFTVSSRFSGIHILEELLYGVTCHYIYGEDKITPEHKEDQLLRKISEFVHLHSGKPVTVEALAAHLNYAPGYLRTLVRKCANCNTKTFIDMERIKIMKALLLYSDVRISELAQLMEFRDAKYFTRFFRKYTGENPRDWLRKSK